MELTGKNIAFVFNGPSIRGLLGDKCFDIVKERCVLVGANDFRAARIVAGRFDIVSLYAFYNDDKSCCVPTETIIGAIGDGVKFIVPEFLHRNAETPFDIIKLSPDSFIELVPDINRDKQHLHETTLVKLIGFFNAQEVKNIFLFGCDGRPGDRGVHFLDDSMDAVGAMDILADTARINKEWKVIKEEFNLTVPVFNVTEGSAISAFPKITVKECVSML